MLNTFENTQTTTSRRLERERQLELMNHAANGTGPFAANTLDSHGSWDDDEIDESLMLDVEGARAAGRPEDTYPSSSYSDTSSTLTPDEARIAAMAALRAADRDHYTNQSYTERKVVSRSPERFRWSPPNVPQIDTDKMDVVDESLDEKAPSRKNQNLVKIERRSNRWMNRADGALKSVSRRTALLALMCLMALAMTIALIIGISHKRNDVANASDTAPTVTSPTEVSLAELQQRIASYVSVITEQDVSSPLVFEDPNSPQYRALLWMAQNELDATDLSADETTELICNRYGLIVLYYANIEPGDEEQFIQGTSPTSSQTQQNAYSDPRDAIADKTGETAPVNYTTMWLSTSFHCTWTGVECFSSSDSPDGAAGYGVVKSLNLTMRGLVGSILEDVPKALNDLITLDMGYNSLTGPIPNSIGSITYANQIYMGGNQLKGSIPSTIGHLVFLDDLYLQENMLTGSIPKEIGNMKELYGLGLYENQLKGAIPSSIGNLTSLYICYLDDNELSGSIPFTIAKLSNLFDFRLRNNKLIGTIPKEIGSMNRLEILYLDNNNFTGTIPSSIGELSPSLRQLHLYKNSLGGTIPDAIGLLEKLELLYLDNNELMGSLPTTMGALVNLESMYIFNNQLNGTLPSSLGNMAYLTNARLNNNKFIGTIPADLGSLSRLQLLFLDTNDFTGTIPTELGRLKRLGEYIRYLLRELCRS